ncbi:MAG: hypothetical protein ACI9H8_001392 [Lysobacterales bacterium]|jgi:uncharacterized protein YggE
MMLPMKFSKNQLKKLMVPALFAFSGFVISLDVVAHGESNSERIISVTGSASVNIEPDLVTVRFGVETQEKTSALALASNAELMQKVTDSLSDTGLNEDEISTSRFDIQAVYDSAHDQQTGRRSQVLSGYRVSNILTVATSKLQLVATIIDTGVAAGVNRVDGVQFSISPHILAEIKDSLIAKSVLNARAKAEKALSALNQSIAGVQNIVLSEFSQQPPMMANMARMDVAMSAPTQIFSSDQEVRTNVSVNFLIGHSDQE